MSLSRALEMFLEACGATGPIELEVLGPNDASPHRHAFDRPFALLGRHRRNELPLEAPEVSPRHSYLQCIFGRLFVLDLNTRAGTLWQGQARSGGWLGLGDVLGIGPFSIRMAPSARIEAETTTSGPPDWDPLEAGSTDRFHLPIATLELLDRSATAPRLRLDRVLTLVGRAPRCHVRLADASVAPNHCALLLSAHGLWVVDLHGKEGTWVNGRCVRWAQLEDGATLQVGNCTLRTGFPHGARSAPGGQFLEALSIADYSSHALPVQAPGLIPGQSLLLNPSPLQGDVESSAATLHQFAAMQQHMLAQFQLGMAMMAQTISGMWQDEKELFREIMDRLGGLNRQVRRLSAQGPKRRASRRSRPGCITASKPEANVTPTTASDPPRAAPAPPPPNDAAQANGTTSTAATETAASLGPEFHAWLNQRIASLDKERQGVWQKLSTLLLGR